MALLFDHIFLLETLNRDFIALYITGRPNPIHAS